MSRKDQWGEVIDAEEGKPGWICDECRFEKKETKLWTIEGPTTVSRHSVINQGHYVGVLKPAETFSKINNGREPKMLMDIHNVSDVNKK